MADLDLEQLGKTFAGGIQALKPTSLHIKDKQFVVLVGPSGCGKTTLLRIIAGLEQATTGTLSLAGACMDKVAPQDRDIAMVFQSYALYPHFTVRENLDFCLRMRRVPTFERAERVQAVATMLHLTDLLDRPVQKLSGGQKQRVAIGRAVVRKPKLFLFDEPFSNLDAALRNSTRVELARLHKQLAATTVLVTHDQVEAMSMAERLVVMKDGAIQQEGSPLHLYRHPANEFVARFLGNPPMNILEAHVLPGRECLKVNGVLIRLPQPAPFEGLVHLGLRAEHIELYQQTDQVCEWPALAARVLNLQPLGNEILASCALGKQEIMTRLHPSSDVRIDQSMVFQLKIEHAVLFHPTTGAAVWPDAGLLDTAGGSSLDKVSLQEHE